MDLMGRPGELFYEDNVSEILRREALPPNCHMERWLPAVIAEGSSPNGYFSTKLFADNLNWLAKTYSNGKWPDPRNSLPGFFSKYFPGAKFVIIHRKDKLAQAISLIKAIQTGVWHSHQRSRVHPRQPYYQRNLIQWAMVNIQEQIHALTQFTELMGVHPIEVYYEDFVQDIPGTIKHLGEQAMVEVQIGQIPEVSLEKLSNRESESWYQRFKQEELDAQSHGQSVFKTPDSNVFEIDLEGAAEAKVPGARVDMRFSIQNLMEENVRFIGKDNHLGTIQLFVYLKNKDSNSNQARELLPVPYSLESNAKEILTFQLQVPSDPGSYTIRIEAEQVGLGLLPIGGDHSVELIVPDDFESSVRSVFGEYQHTSDNWYYSSWFGYFYPSYFPWVFSLNHGWIRVCNGCDGGIFDPDNRVEFEDFHFGRWETTPSQYPRITRAGTTTRYQRTDSESREFKDDNGEFLRIPLVPNIQMKLIEVL
jgi:LPS sulfotransferase NodH